jgi:hypothetical protein
MTRSTSSMTCPTRSRSSASRATSSPLRCPRSRWPSTAWAQRSPRPRPRLAPLRQVRLRPRQSRRSTARGRVDLTDLSLAPKGGSQRHDPLRGGGHTRTPQRLALLGTDPGVSGGSRAWRTGHRRATVRTEHAADGAARCRRRAGPRAPCRRGCRDAAPPQLPRGNGRSAAGSQTGSSPCATSGAAPSLSLRRLPSCSASGAKAKALKRFGCLSVVRR